MGSLADLTIRSGRFLLREFGWSRVQAFPKRTCARPKISIRVVITSPVAVGGAAAAAQPPRWRRTKRTIRSSSIGQKRWPGPKRNVAAMTSRHIHSEGCLLNCLP